MSLTAPILGTNWRIVDSPEPLYNAQGHRYMTLVDRQQLTIWVDPEISPADRPAALVAAVCRAVNSDPSSPQTLDTARHPMRTDHSGKTIDPDCDPVYVKRRGWRDAKRALGPDGYIVEQMKRLETLPGCPRHNLAVALHTFSNLSADARAAAAIAFDEKSEPRHPQQRRRPRGHILNPWRKVKKLLLATQAHHLRELAKEMTDLSAELGYDECLLLALALYAATNWEEEDARRVTGEFCAHFSANDSGVPRADGGSTGTADEPRATPQAAPEATQRQRAHHSLPREEMAALSRDVLEAEWKLMAPPGWKLPPNLPAGVMLRLTETSGGPPVLWHDMNPICPQCGKVYQVGAWLGRHLIKKHGWSRNQAGGLRPPARHEDEGQDGRGQAA